MQSRRLARHIAAVAVLVPIAAAAVIGCGSSDDSSTTSAASSPSPGTTADAPAPAAAKTPTGSPLEIWTMSPVAQPSGDIPQVFAGVKAAARAINARGGIRGHKIVVKTCNTLMDPNQEATCARNAVSAHALAMVGNIPIINPAGVTNTLQEAHTPNVVPFMGTPQDYVNPINFPVTAQNFAVAACGAMVPKVSGSKKVAVASINLPISLSNAALAGAAAKAHGADFAGTIPFPVTTADLGPVIQRVRKTGADMVILGMQPQIIAQFVSTATSQGNTWTYCVQDGTVYHKTLVDLGGVLTSFYAGSVLPPLQDAAKYPELQRFAADMKAELAAGDKDASLDASNTQETALTPWLGMQVIDQVAGKMTGPINNRTFLKALNEAKVSFGNLLPQIDFATPNPNPKYARLFNTRVFLKKWDPAKKRYFTVTSVPPAQGDALAAG
jgi:ABC-type branched-subunit amino acid transport system substrate-binding protein